MAEETNCERIFQDKEVSTWLCTRKGYRKKILLHVVTLEDRVHHDVYIIKNNHRTYYTMTYAENQEQLRQRLIELTHHMFPHI